MAITKEKLDLLTKTYIEKYYPKEKQQSDMVDQMFWTAWLTRYTTLSTNTIGTEVYLGATNIMLYGSTVDTETQNIITKYGTDIIVIRPDITQDQVPTYLQEMTQKEYIAFSQLIKVGVRTGWVQQIKTIYYQLLSDQLLTDDQLYYTINEKYFQLYKI